MDFKGLQIQPNFSLEVQPVKIVDTQVKGTRNKQITSVKVRWSDNDRDVTWELESEICDKYTYLFDSCEV